VSAALIEHAILDRDGVLNRELESGWVAEPEQWQWEVGSLAALRQLAQLGVRISVVSNQSGIGRGVVEREQVEEVHRWLTRELRAAGVELSGIYICPHAPDEGCSCRKPRPGLVRQALEVAGIPAERSFLIGDDQRDLEAGRAAGVRTALVLTGKGRKVRNQIDPDTLVFENLWEAVVSIFGLETGATGVT
jgi:D-glycero-D-manno-heptose 1,7-bisphosphate phosphatase